VINLKKTLLVAALLGFGSAQTLAAVSADEAKKLGDTLTPMGAVLAGNAEGTIPAWDASLELKSEDPVYMTDPMQGDKPLYSITVDNLEQYKDKLSAGALKLFATHSDFRIDVYETKRTAVAPDAVNQGTIANATKTSLVNDGLTLKDWGLGTPFPIPQNGIEAVWNHLVRWKGLNNESVSASYYVGDSGNPVQSSVQLVTFSVPVAAPEKDWGEMADQSILFRADFWEPVRRAGEITLVRDPSDFSEGNGRKAWQYLAGQRRVRRAPSVAFDTPAPSTAGSSTYDDTYLYNGSPERYDWELIGKQECIVPYNNWGVATLDDHQQAMGAKFFNPDILRWELHRCWVVEGSLKEGQRHIYQKRRYMMDEDSWHMLAGDLYDARGELWRANFAVFAHSYMTKAFWSTTTVMYDFQAKQYNVNGFPKKDTWTQMKPMKPANYYTPAALKRSGSR
jgi:hypothetical protein